jgi:hypothetical protein
MAREYGSRMRVTWRNGDSAEAPPAAIVPVCVGRACSCISLGGEPADDCPKGPPRWVTFNFGPNGWVPNAA